MTSLRGQGGHVDGYRNGVERSSAAYSGADSQSKGAVQRAAPVGDGQNMESMEEMTLMEKWRAHYSGNKSKVRTNSKVGFRVLFQVQANTQLYMIICHLIPFVMADLDPWTQYYAKVFMCYIFAMGQANWLATICYCFTSSLPDFRDKPNADSFDWIQNPAVKSPDDQTPPPAKDRYGLEWTFCTRCQRYRPPRSHHCDLCQTCILRRDHHCYLVGNCVGHYNQRYFIPLMMNTAIFCFFGNILNFVYLSHNSSDASAWYDFLYPVAMLKFCLGLIGWKFCLLTFHCTMCTVFGLMALLYFLGSLMLVISGKTLFEVAKKVDIRINSSVNENFQVVFGDYWFANFLFPAVLLFKQRNDGMSFEKIQMGSRQVKVDFKET